MCCAYVNIGNKKSVSKVFLCNLKKIVYDILPLSVKFRD